MTFRRTYSSWAHDKDVPGKIVAELMGHAKVDTTRNIYTQVRIVHLRDRAIGIRREVDQIVREP